MNPAGSPPRTFDAAQVSAFLRFLLPDPSLACVELRLWSARFNFKTNFIEPATLSAGNVLSGWYDRPDTLIADAQRLLGVSAYVTSNPVSRDLLSLSYNQLARVKTNTTDNDIVRLSNLFLDIDARRKTGISSTDAELAAALGRRDAILGDFPEFQAASVWGCSGNGGLILARTPGYPNEAEGRALWARVVDGFVARYSDNVVEVGPQSKNPARVMPLPGTVKCKGSHRPERPHRLVTLAEECRGRLAGPVAGLAEPVAGAASWLQDGLVPVDLREIAGRLPDRAAAGGQPGRPTTVQMPGEHTGGLANGTADNGPANGAANGSGNGQASQTGGRQAGQARGRQAGKPVPPPEGVYDPAWAAYRCQKMIFGPKFRESVAGLKGHDALFHAAAVIWSGFGLTDDVGFRLFEEWNQSAKPPEDEYQVKHKWESVAKKKGTPTLKEYWEARQEDTFHHHHHRNGNASTSRNGNGQGQAEHPLELEEREFTDMGNAKRLTDIAGEHIRYCKVLKEWFYFDETRWIADDRHQIDAYAKMVPARVLAEIPPTQNDDTINAYRKWYMMSQSDARITAMMRLARSEPGISVLPEQLDRNPWLLNLANGTLDLQTKEFREHRASDMITKIAPVLYDPDAEAPTWKRFLSEILDDDPELIDYVHRAVGYAITGIIREHVFFFLQGGGANGKTTFLKTLTAVLGDYANEIDSEIILAQALGQGQHPTGLTELEGRRFIVADESEENRRLAEGLIKRITGGNKISARKMRKDFYTFKPTHHIFLASNYRPEIKGTDRGIRRRVKLIPFDVSFDPDAPGGRVPDLKLEEKLAAEFPGILNWMIDGCTAWQQRGLEEPEVVRRLIQSYFDEMDVLGWFVEECCVACDPEPPNPRDRVKTLLSQLYGLYKGWCGLNNVSSLGLRRFSGILSEKGFATHKVHSLVYKRDIRPKTEGEKAAEAAAAAAEDGQEDVPF